MSNQPDNPPPAPDPLPPQDPAAAAAGDIYHEFTPSDPLRDVAAETGPAEMSPEPAPPTPVVLVSCWRCGLAVQEGLTCPHCHAAPRGEVPAAVVAAPKVDRYTDFQRKPPRVLGVILAYVLLLMTSLIWAAVLVSTKNPSQAFVEQGMIVIEVVDFLFTLFLFLWLGRFHVRKPKVSVRVLAYCLAPLFSVAMFFLGKWYIDLLQSYIKPHWFFMLEEHWEFTTFYVLTVAVQPAIVEELFFRYFAFGALRQVTNTHSAVVLSAMMFALAHLYNPLGLPFLFLMGIMLGYARAYSGGLLLPMLMHFAHNAAILWFESA
jgi:membrane protease YdiL (CAAX protease family)